MSNIVDVTNHPIILMANRAVLSAGTKLQFPIVQSRMLLWCTENGGYVTVNGFRYTLNEDTFLFLPWNHSIRYNTFEYKDMHIAGIHLIPNLPHGVDINYHICHNRRPGNTKFRITRHDSDLGDLRGVRTGQIKKGGDLRTLADYIISWYSREPRKEIIARALAKQLLYEIRYNLVHKKHVPVKLRIILDYIQTHYSSHLELSDLANAGSCSISTTIRLFHNYMDISPIKLLQKTRINKAAEILSTSTISSSEAALSVGIEDYFYFSRLFKKFMGTTVREYRMNHSIIK